MTPAFPTVSVIMPARNGERFIAEALASVSAQKIEPLEILVVDGQSTDRSRDIANGFSGVRVLAQPGRGVPDAYNFGIASARGELIAFLECDDMWTPDKLSVQVGHMLRKPELQFTLAHVEMFLQPGCALPPGYRAEWLERPQTGSVLSTFLARKSVFDVVGKFDSHFSRAGDVDWFARAKDLGARMEILPETLLRKRIHDCNLTSAVAVNNLEMLDAVKRSIARQRGISTMPNHG